MTPFVDFNLMDIHPDDVLTDPQNPKCLGHYMERGNYVDSEGDWWAHYCGSSTCPRVADCYSKTQQNRMKPEPKGE